MFVFPSLKYMNCSVIAKLELHSAASPCLSHTSNKKHRNVSRGFREVSARSPVFTICRCVHGMRARCRTVWTFPELVTWPWGPCGGGPASQLPGALSSPPAPCSWGSFDAVLLVPVSGEVRPQTSRVGESRGPPHPCTLQA